MVGQPLDREVGIEAASFRQGGLRLIHLACERIGGGQIYVRYKIVGACVDRLLKFVDSGVETPETEFRHTQINEPVGSFRIARTQPHRLLRIGFGLLETTKGYFSESSRVKQRRVVRIDRETGVGGAERFIRAARTGQIKAFRGIRPHVVGGERNSSVGLIDDSSVEICFRGGLSESVEGHIGEGFARERVGVIRVGLERLVEQGQRGVVGVALLLRRFRVRLPHGGPTAHGQIDGVRVL